MGRFSTLLLGGIIGAGIALLTTPRTGAENRALLEEKLNESYPEAMNTLNTSANQLADAAATTSTKVINTVWDMGSEVKKDLATRVEQTTPLLIEKNDELRDKIDAARERITAQVVKNAEAVHDTAADKVPAALDAAKQAGEAVAGAAQSATDAAKEVAQSAAGAAKDVAASATEAAKGVAASATEVAKDVAENAAEAAKGATKAAKDAAAKVTKK